VSCAIADFRQRAPRAFEIKNGGFCVMLVIVTKLGVSIPDPFAPALSPLRRDPGNALPAPGLFPHADHDGSEYARVVPEPL